MHEENNQRNACLGRTLAVRLRRHKNKRYRQHV